MKTLLICSIGFLLGYSLSMTRSVNRETQERAAVKKSLDSLQVVTDSLQSEVFIHTIDAGRYESAIEMLKEKDAKAYAVLDEILSHME